MKDSASFSMYRAHYVMPMSAPVIEGGAVVVRDGVIVAVGKYHDLEREYIGASYHDLGSVILMPGLINAHCHLDYTMMRGKLTPGSRFATWVQELNKIKFSLHEDDWVKSIVEGAQELRSWGCTTLCNIESFPELLPKLPALPIRLWQCVELMDIRGRTQGEEGLAITEQFLNQEQTTRNHVGISPHAPQTCSQELYRGAALLAKKHDISFCTHLAESEEEMEMFTQGSGPLFDFLKHFGRDMSDCGFQTPVQALLKNDLLPHGSLLVHMNFLNAEDRALLASRGADFFVIHCPKTHQFFKRPPFDWKFFYEHDYPLLLGTDSLASNNSLNLFEEMRAMAATAPELAPEEILTMVTLSPAAAFGMKGQLGELSCGALSEMIAIPFEGKLQDVVEAVVDNGVQPMVI